ncbi:nucleolar protein 12-domain-containing protein [Gigaspora rosea]|uniref:Nucleolar protein 12-domain-containing protein n=2 Tax=Gigaspora TaxID=4873 RepID=A0A397TSQ4_9GLOM|nr:nucleolar protein 12-domain-containing protein [Gigaspora rosea]
MDNLTLLTEGSKIYSEKRKRKNNQIPEIVFDENARREYLTGFHKRKLERQAKAKKIALERVKKEKAEIKKAAKEAQKRQIEEKLAATQAMINISSKRYLKYLLRYLKFSKRYLKALDTVYSDQRYMIIAYREATLWIQVASAFPGLLVLFINYSSLEANDIDNDDDDDNGNDDDDGNNEDDDNESEEDTKNNPSTRISEYKTPQILTTVTVIEDFNVSESTAFGNLSKKIKLDNDDKMVGKFIRSLVSIIFFVNSNYL